jgi:branched-chain amino acid transport system ATP-binding protein
MLTVEELTTDYGPIRAVDGVSLEVPEGSITAVLGANGAGKTSLLRTICGLERATSGHVKVEGEDITRWPVEEIVRFGVAHVPEGRGVIAELTVIENLRLGGLWRGREAMPIREVYELFPRLEERADQPASRLSGGERQMLSIGRALMGRPRALLLDEPSLGLAPVMIDVVFDALAELRDDGVTILLVEQNAARAVEFADRAYLLRSGRMTHSGTREEFLNMEDFETAYLGV